nr:beta-galactosidase [Jiangella mangrovi]
MSYGGDYNPEQWSEDVWLEDVELMREAGVNLVSVGIFAWGSLEPREGQFEFGWLDRVLELLHGAGIAVDLATPTASPPIWLHRKHPDILPVSRTGQRYAQGGRLGWCASHPTWREHSLRIVRTLAERYGDHPAVRMWHVGNEFGGGNRLCYCDHSAAHFQRWLAQRFTTIDALNAAWGTAFWGHRYAGFDDVLPPRDAESPGNPSLELDYRRFASDALLEQYRAERAVLRELSPDRPATTNFMVGRGPHVVDYAGWAADMDLLANDHYTYTDDDARAQDVAFAADRMRGLSRGAPWLLMEHSTSAVSWQPRNRAKDPGELARNSLAHVARGSDGAMFFQWRQSASGAEQFHSAMVPHAGRDTRLWREVVELGATLRDLSDRGLRNTRTEPARVALIMDDAAGWAWQAGPKPHHDLDLNAVARAYHRALWERNVLVDVVPPGTDLDGYAVVLVPGLFLVDGDLPARLRAAANDGAQVVVGFLSGIVDAHNRVVLGGYPGAFRDLLGVVAEEFRPLRDDQSATLDNGWTATAWTEHVRLAADDTETVAAYTDGAIEGLPAVTRRPLGTQDGAAWYVSARLDEAALGELLTRVTEAAAVVPTADAPPGVEVVRRIGDDGVSFLFAFNHSGAEVTVLPVGADPVRLAAGAATVVQEARR